MIRTENEYREALRTLQDSGARLEQYRAALEAKGYSESEVENGMNPLLSFHQQIQEEIEWFDNVRRGHLGSISSLTDIGKLLIGLRVYHGYSQRELADLLNVSEALVSRDERNEYHGITVERAQRIIDAMNGQVSASIQARDDDLQLVGV